MSLLLDQVLSEVLEVMDKHATALRGIFARYCRGGAGRRHPDGQRRMSEESFLKFAKVRNTLYGINVIELDDIRLP